MEGLILIKEENKRREKEENVRVLETVATFDAAKELLRETDIAAHATDGLKIHH